MSETATLPVAPASTNGTAKKINGKLSEREKAKLIGVSLVQFRVLAALGKATKELTYREIEAKTGYYSNLTVTLRPSQEGSLGAAGLVKEQQEDKVLTFVITAKGRKLLEKVK